MQAQRVYPHIAAQDAAEGVNAAWLRTLNEAAYGFRRAAGLPRQRGPGSLVVQLAGGQGTA